MTLNSYDPLNDIDLNKNNKNTQKTIVIVTAVSANHVCPLLEMLATIAKYDPELTTVKIRKIKIYNDKPKKKNKKQKKIDTEAT